MNQGKSEMRIIADANMPGLEQFERHGTVIRVDGRSIDSSTVAEADVLLVRSVTRVNEALLAESPVSFVGSATIGTDHVDLPWLASTGRHFAHAPGCNARAVAEYVLQALLLVCEKTGRSVSTLSVGVVGMGNVGSRVASWMAMLGLSVKVCDPLLEEKGIDTGFEYAPLESLLTCDVVTLHVPLTREGNYPTWHLLSEARIAALGPERILINTCRGPVIDNAALLGLLSAGAAPSTVLDVWEEEPRVPPDLLAKVVMGSPHIAGYSVQGKQNGTRMVYDAFCRWAEVGVATAPPAETAPRLLSDVNSQQDLLELLQTAYRLPDDDKNLRAIVKKPDSSTLFDQLRKHYPLRQELHHWQWQGRAADPFKEILGALFRPD